MSKKKKFPKEVMRIINKLDAWKNWHPDDRIRAAKMILRYGNSRAVEAAQTVIKYGPPK